MVGPKRYVKKQIVVEAMVLDFDNWDAISEFAEVGKVSHGRLLPGMNGGESRMGLVLNTDSGPVTVQPGWWIIKGVEGELYPCSPSVFEKTYQEAIGKYDAQWKPSGVREPVAFFAIMMEQELQEHDDDRGVEGWRSAHAHSLYRHLWQEVTELGDLIKNMDTDPLTRDAIIKVGEEAADVANLSMMVADVCGVILRTETVSKEVVATLLPEQLAGGPEDPSGLRMRGGV